MSGAVILLTLTLLANQVGPVTDALGPGVIFQLELKDRNYILRATDGNEAAKWVHKLTVIRDEAKANTIPEEPPSPRNATSRSTAAENKDMAKESSARTEAVGVEGAGWGKTDKKCCCIIS